ncbi:MAG: nucleotidyltransferase family protein [Candidatus Nanopelagicaceae bacterium]
MSQSPVSAPISIEDLYQRLGFGLEVLLDLCQRWKIKDFAVFGSVLRDDFSAESDIDTLVTFLPENTWTLFDIVHLQQELEALTGRAVDVAQKPLLRNPYRRAEILKTCQVLYDSRRSNASVPVGYDRCDRSTANLSSGQDL